MKKRAIILFILLFLPSVVWGATWYVRPETGEYGAEDGTAYATAFDGAADLLSSWAGSGIAAGDTIYICGAFDNETFTFGAAQTGTTGTPIFVRGGYVGDRGELTGGSGTDHSMKLQNSYYIDVRGLTFINPDNTKANIYMAGTYGDVISGNTFTGTGSSDGNFIYIYYAGTNTWNNDITNNTFSTSDDAAIEGVLDAGVGTLFDLEVTKNTATNVQTLIDLQGDQADAANAALGISGVTRSSMSPHTITIDDNTITDPELPGIRIRAGLSGTNPHTGVSVWNYIRRNTITSAGDGTTANVNGMQLNWVCRTYIEKNEVSGTLSSSGDGKGIILDWGWTSDEHISSDNIVRWNYTHDNRSNNNSGGGISVYRGMDNEIYGNKSVNDSFGLKLAGSASTDNVFYNNTIVASGKDSFWAESDTLVNTATVTNNLFSGPRHACIDDDGGGAGSALVLSYNLYHNCASLGADVYGNTKGTGAVSSDPIFNSGISNYHINLQSPARDAGTAISTVTTDIDGDTIPLGHGTDIGADELALPDAANTTGASNPDWD